MEENDIKNKENKKDKRKISILTVALVLVLIIVMLVVVINGIVKKNAVEDTDVETRKITVKVDFSELFESLQIEGEKEKIAFMQNEYYVATVKTNNITDYANDFDGYGEYISNEGDIGIYECNITNEARYIMYHTVDNKIFGGIENDTNDIINVEDSNYNILFYAEEIKEEKQEYIVKLVKTNNITIIKLDLIESDNVNFDISFKQLEENIEYYTVLQSENERIYAISPISDVEYRIEIDAYNMSGPCGGTIERDNIYILDYEGKIVDGTFIVKPEEAKNKYDFKVVGKINKGFKSIIKWEDEKNASLDFEVSEYYYLDKKRQLATILVEKLDENFKVSDEYKNDKEWLIVNEEDIKDTKLSYQYEYWANELKEKLKDNEDMPEYIYGTFLEFTNGAIETLSIRTDIRCIYVKDKNILYCLLPYEKDNNRIKNIKLECKGFEKNKEYEFFTRGINFNFYDDSSINREHCISSKRYYQKLKYEEREKANIIVNKIQKDKVGEEKCYVGIFENEIEKVTDRVYDINVIDGIGSTNIEIEGYDKNKEYFLYEVDKNGNKLEDEKIRYNKNKVLENVSVLFEGKISKSDDINSYVYCKDYYMDSISKSYSDNYLNMTKVYEDTVIISENDEKVYLVKYESDGGGVLEGDLQELVKEGEKPIKIPEVKPNKNYEFEKWVVVKNGEEIEVVPSEYIVLEDTTFIAKYKRIEKEVENIVKEEKPNLPDTSDINIWLYVGIFVIIILIICIIICVLVIIRKKNK